MTREEATRILESGGWWDLLDPDGSDADLDPLHEAIGVAIDALRAQQTGGWISVKERLPERPEYDWVLVIARFGTEGIFGVPHVAEYVYGKWQFNCLDSTDAEDFLQVTVTHWQPLPEPPKGD